MESLLGSALIITSCIHLAAVLASGVGRVEVARPWGLSRRHARERDSLSLPPVLLLVLLGGATGAALCRSFLPMFSLRFSAGVTLLVLSSVWSYALLRPRLRAAGAALWVTWIAFSVAAVAWGAVFLAQLGRSLSPVTMVLLWSSAAIALVTLPAAVVQTREAWEPFLRRRWLRRHDPLHRYQTSTLPRICIHVPIHAEPPELVLGTLDRIAALDYPDLHVIVVDNNTTDPALWLPVQERCAQLGPTFRFLHVENLRGAKAGALNVALRHTDPSVELVAVVDADYHVDRDWLARTVGFFDDPAMGFVQGPHAYRATESSRFQRWAEWEYAIFFATGMVSLDEQHAGLTVGTMSVIRRTALELAGGWAEWCLTEDSELAIRLHGLGYDSVYLTEPLGRGLVPETFAGYRRQRFRWSYGPVQELRHHWRMFLPRWLGGRHSRLTASQKLHHGNHGWDIVCVGLRTFAVPLGAVAGLSMLAHDEVVQVPFELWIAASVLLVGTLFVRWLIYRKMLNASLSEAVGGIAAFAALSHVITVASLRSLLGRPARWQRTDKFGSKPRGWAVVSDAGVELVVAVVALVAAGVLVVLGTGSIAMMLGLGLAVVAVGYVAAPVIAVVSERDVAAKQPASVTRPVEVALPSTPEVIDLRQPETFPTTA